MQTYIILSVLAAAFCHALWNASVKRGRDSLSSVTAMNLCIGILALPFLPWVGLPHSASLPYLVATTLFHFGYNVSLAKAYQHGDFSHIYPLARGTAPLLVTLWGVLVLRESLSVVEWLGLAGILGGILLFVTRSLESVLAQRTAWLSALATAFFIAAYTISDGLGARLSGNVAAYIAWLLFLDGIPITVYALRYRSITQILQPRGAWRSAVFAAVLSMASYAIVVWAMSRAPIPLVAALRETSIVIAALIGAYYFKERSGKRRIIASILICISVALLAGY